jgi:Rrf2 family protein
MAKAPDTLYSASHLIEKLNVSDKYLRRLMTDLCKSGFIQSIQGREGGYRFIRDTREIFIYDVINSVENLDKLSGCVLGLDKCSCENPCAMHDTWLKVRSQIDKVYRETRLSDLDFNNTYRY